jgi:hypothetical protein
MKRADLQVTGVVILVLLPFFIFPSVLSLYEEVNAAHPYLMSFIKFAILATFGECLGLRLRTGVYNKPGFGLLPRAIVWGFLGIVIKIAFVIFAEGAPVMLKTFGVSFPPGDPADVLRMPGFSGIKLLAAFAVGTTLNLLFAPVFMAFHRITDMHIQRTGGTFQGFFTRIRIGQSFKEINWYDFWDFVLKKTIPLFWIPAQTLNFMLPENYRILVAALYSIILGVLMSMAAMMHHRKD